MTGPTPRRGQGAAARPRRSARPLDWRTMLHLQLHALGFVATTLLLSWGVFVLALLVLGGVSVDGLMAQLDNLAARYVAADPGRQLQFKEIVGVANLLVVIVLIMLRRGALLPPAASLGTDHA